MSDKEYKWSPQNPSPNAVAKVKDPMPVPNFCIHCGEPVRLGTHAEIYDGSRISLEITVMIAPP